MRTILHHIALGALGGMLLMGCDPTKRVPAGSHLLNRTRVVVHKVYEECAWQVY